MPRNLEIGVEMYLVFTDTTPGKPLDLNELANLKFPKPTDVLLYPTTVVASRTTDDKIIIHPEYGVMIRHAEEIIGKFQRTLSEKYGKRLTLVEKYLTKETKTSCGSEPLGMAFD